MVDCTSPTQQDSFPDSENAAQKAAEALGFTIIEACLPGVLANLLILRRHAEQLTGKVQAE